MDNKLKGFEYHSVSANVDIPNFPRCEICKALGIFTFYTFTGLGMWFCTRRCKCIWLVNEIKRLIGIWDLVHLEAINFYLEKVREEIKNMEI